MLWSESGSPTEINSFITNLLDLNQSPYFELVSRVCFELFVSSLPSLLLPLLSFFKDVKPFF